MRTAYAIPALLAVLLLFADCSRAPVAGGSTDSPNARVFGKISDVNGVSARHTQVFLIPNDFIPTRDSFALKAKADTTDDSGKYVFAKVDSGTYNIQALDQVDRTSLLINDLAVRPAKVDDPVLVPDGVLRPSRVIKVSVPQTQDSLQTCIYVPGTTVSTTVTASAQTAFLNSVPCGTLPSIRMIKSGSDSSVTLFRDIVVDSLDTLFLNFSAKITINTSASGANIAGAVFHFPLCIRLTGSNFNFSQSLPDGGDLHFTKQDGTPLRYEIAQWDTGLKQAVVWVSVDTIYGNNSSQYFLMSWGQMNQKSQSGSAPVFDTGYGFTGVWHLEEEKAGTGNAGVYKDATQNKTDGTDNIASLGQDGIVGRGHNFNGKDQIIVYNSVITMAGHDFTMGLWLNLRQERGLLVSKDTAALQDSCVKDLFFGDATSDKNGLHPSFGGKGNGYAVSDGSVPLNEWHYIVFRWSQGNAAAGFYIDGVKTGPIDNTYTAGCADNPKDRIVFGYNNNDANLLFGFLDEIHISGVARSDDWIRLSFENQRPDQKLITIQK